MLNAGTRLIRLGAAAAALTFALTCGLAAPAHLYAGFSDKVAAFVDNEAITMNELEDQFQRTVKLYPSTTRMEVLNTIINRLLLLREARRYRIEAPTPEDAMKEYIDLKVRAFIRVDDSRILQFYHEHAAEFPGKDVDDLRDELEQLIIEQELNVRLKDAIAGLRAKAHIRIHLPAK